MVFCYGSLNGLRHDLVQHFPTPGMAKAAMLAEVLLLGEPAAFWAYFLTLWVC